MPAEIQKVLKSIAAREDLLKLFREVLGFRPPKISTIPFVIDHDIIKNAEAIAESGSFKVYYLNLTQEFAETLRSEHEIRKFERQILVKLESSERRRNLFIFSDSKGRYWDFVCPDEHGKRLVLRRFTLRPDNRDKLRTPAEQLALLRVGDGEEDKIGKKLEAAFSVEAVSAKFFQEFKDVFHLVENSLKKQSTDIERLHRFTHQLLNRLMFLYFVQRRGVFKDKDFLNTFWNAYRNKFDGKDEFYDKWLKKLFFEALNGKFVPKEYLKISADLDFNSVLELAPHLNGGLFKEDTEIDFLDVKISDKLFVKVFEFLEAHNFTVRENTPLDEDLEIDPEMLGNIYEMMVNVSERDDEDERHSGGIFYTPRTEIDFMLRRSLVEYLFNNTAVSKLKLYQFVFPEVDEEARPRFPREEIKSLYDALDSITIVDPACGSGHYLVVAVQTIFELKKHLRHMMGNREDAFIGFQEKLKIIENSIFGIDVMRWAGEIAKLRLWLDLVVEAKDEQLRNSDEALLPNLSFKIRIGDSLVQEVGGKFFPVRGSPHVPPSLRALRNQLVTAKKDYFYGRHGIDETFVKSKEVQFFRAIVDERMNDCKKEIRELENSVPKDQSLFGSKQAKQLTLGIVDAKTQQKIDLKKEEMARLTAERETISMKREFAVWPIEFAEILSGRDGDGGFDIVIANPPYVRQELIDDPAHGDGTTTKKIYKEKLLKQTMLDWNDEKGHLIKISQRADLYVYFYLKGLQLLNDKGVMCFISSNSWLDVGFGAELQEVLLRRVPILAIYDNQAKRSFKHADVNTIIALLGAPRKEWDKSLKENATKFVMFKKPFEEVIFTEILWQIEAAKKQRLVTDEFRLVQKNQQELYEEGVEEKVEGVARLSKEIGGIYGGNKWGGKYLRAPDIYWVILQKGGIIVGAAGRARRDSSGLHDGSKRVLLSGGRDQRPKLVRLGDIAEIRFGIKTGANEFFYLEDTTENMKFEEIKSKIQNLGGYKNLAEIKKAGLRICCNDKTGDYWLIEEEFLKPVLKSPKDSDTLTVDATKLDSRILMCHFPRKELKGKLILQYIAWGESRKFHERPTTKNRNVWWDLGRRNPARLNFNYLINDVGVTFLGEIFVSDNFHEIHTSQPIEIFLNSSIFWLFQNLTGRTSFGGGLLKIQSYELENIYVLPVKQKSPIKHRLSSGIFEELGLDSSRPIREQEPKPLPDRKVLDDIVFDALGLTAEECKEVYWAVAELVQNRLNKAKST